MIDVGGKPATHRRAVARARVVLPVHVAERIRAGTLPKGDVLATARVAGIMAAKRTPDLIPLCHPLPLTMVEVEPALEADGVTITAAAETTAQTGVEMEALVAVVTAALTVYDMTKGLDPTVSIERAELVEKSGGKSGHWRRDEA
jgi:cyclic pyranopterin monophosphate synthase